MASDKVVALKLADAEQAGRALQLNDLDEALHCVLSWGSDVEVLAPRPLKDIAVTAVRDTLRLWQRGR